MRRRLQPPLSQPAPTSFKSFYFMLLSSDGNWVVPTCLVLPAAVHGQCGSWQYRLARDAVPRSAAQSRPATCTSLIEDVGTTRTTVGAQTPSPELPQEPSSAKIYSESHFSHPAYLFSGEETTGENDADPQFPAGSFEPIPREAHPAQSLSI
ncbi:hypothetical protein F2Q69_00035801 [Brassica cretica]|uniref:Uncharacterized protein n=1 Tax=Brassica cretica TaxID=69181 RepID=A0A8S9ST63_BRACR|nr:hypothetical protein F2Q69_00035801 [Brassica cretica]